MSPLIHPSAIVSPHADLSDTAEIGPFCVVEGDVTIGDHTKLYSHAVVASGTTIGKNVHIHTGAVIGTFPQDLKFNGEKTRVKIGDRTVIREYVTINRGTTSTEITVVGEDVLLMAYVHVAHDCVVGDKVVLANSCQLGGHVTIGYHAIVGGLVGIHQFCSVGSHAMVAGTSFVTKDIPPFTLSGRDPICVEGLNTVGLRRRGFSAEDIAELQHFYRKLYNGGLNISDALEAYLQETKPSENIQECIRFIRNSKRGIARFHS